MPNPLLDKIKQAVIDSDAEAILALTEEAITAGYEPLEIIDKALVTGMRVVGDKYECGEYFLPHLIIYGTDSRLVRRMFFRRGTLFPGHHLGRGLPV